MFHQCPKVSEVSKYMSLFEGYHAHFVNSCAAGVKLSAQTSENTVKKKKNVFRQVRRHFYNNDQHSC